MTFWQKNKWKILAPVLIVLVLAAAFVFGDQNIPAQPKPAEQPTISAPVEAPEQPAMDLSRDKNAEEMKWSPLEMGAAMQAHGA